MQKYIITLACIATLAAGCSKPAEKPTIPTRKAIAAPILPILHVPDQHHQRIMSPSNILFGYSIPFYSFVPFNPEFIRANGITKAEKREYSDFRSPQLKEDSREDGLSPSLIWRYKFNQLGFCEEELCEGYEKGKLTYLRRARFFCDAQGRPLKKEVLKVDWDAIPLPDTTTWDTTTFEYDGAGRLTAMRWVELEGSTNYATIAYDDMLGIATLTYSGDDGLAWTIDVFEAAGALTDSMRMHIAEDLIASHAKEKPKGRNGEVLDEIRFFATDGYEVTHLRNKKHKKQVASWGEYQFDEAGRILSEGSFGDMTTYTYGPKGDLVYKVIQQPSEGHDNDRMITYRYLYNDDGTLQEEVRRDEYFGEYPNTSIWKRFFTFEK